MTSAATLIRYASDGTRLWTRSWVPSKDASTAGVAVGTGPNGSIYLLGTVHGQCEGGGWFIRAYASNGVLRDSYVTPGWRSCSLAETPFGIAVSSRLVVVVGMDNGCCGDPMQDGWVRSFTPTLSPSWSAPFEPPAGIPASFFDRATGVAIAHGSIFVAGWAATHTVPSGSEGMTTPGTVILEKLTTGGSVLWSRRPGVPMPGLFGVVSVAATFRTEMVTAPVRGLPASTFWGPQVDISRAWLGQFTGGGKLVQSWTWGTKKAAAAEPTGVSTSGKWWWVVGTQRDPSDGGLDAFVTTFSQHRRFETIHLGDQRFMFGTGVVGRYVGAFVTGFTGDRFGQPSVGHVWALSP